MRIDHTVRVSNLAGKPGTSRVSGRDFIVDEGAETESARPTVSTQQLGSLDSLLALQAVTPAGDALERRRRLVRRGRSLLDILDGIRAELISGPVGPERLQQLVLILAQPRDQDDAQLNAVMDDIELRVRVELAKHGIYTI